MVRATVFGDSVPLAMLVRWCRDWVNLSPWRRRIVWFFGITVALFVIPGVLGAVATAQSGTAAGGASIDALGWMNIRDSSGVRLTDYMYAASRGSLFNPMQGVLVTLLELLLVGYLVLVTAALWVIGYAVSFRWLDPIGGALTGVADGLTGQIATPLVLTVAAAIGAFCVAWFVVRGYHAKAAIQVVTMVAIAILGPIFLAHPLADVLSSHGLLAQGRDLGVSVAAGLDGQSNPNPGQLVAGLQGDLADNFARRPVQVWNFGHVIDQSPRCGAAWSTGVQSGDQARVLEGLKACGDATAFAKADKPGMGQIGSGLVLLICATILLVFGVYLAVKIIWAALDSMYHAVMSVFGFAAGGFIYGPTQTFLVRNIVDSFVGAARMTAFTLFLGIYMLLLGNLFEQARGQVMVVLVLGAIVESVAVLQVRRLSAGISRGNDWIANRFSLAIQGAGRSGGGSAGAAFGMGPGGTSHSIASGLLTGAAAINTLNGNPVTALLFGNKRSPWDPNASLRNRAEKSGWKANAEVNEKGWQVNYMRTRENVMEAARSAVEEYGGHTHRSAAAAVDRVVNRGGSLGDVASAMIDAGYTDHDMIVDAMRCDAMRCDAGPQLSAEFRSERVGRGQVHRRGRGVTGGAQVGPFACQYGAVPPDRAPAGQPPLYR
ncbi:hypothetical protein AB0B25_22990 [Nocardia sp. NPDC049190]|uniref:hypothetical protein n=1 Tax=Nocardia sp. NPDC049190 TaxID=3155650 RepID=UPI003410774B